MAVQIENIVRKINRELVPRFEQRLREELTGRDRGWLIEQIVRLTMDAHSLREKDSQFHRQQKQARRAQRLLRIKQMGLNPQILKDFMAQYRDYDRAKLLAEGHFNGVPPEKGTREVTAKDLSAKGCALLEKSKDLFFAVLFGDASSNTHFQRIHQSLLSITLPQSKAAALDFMQAVTEIGAEGTWRDPKNISNDEDANNLLLQVEYGEAEGDLLGHGIIKILSLINNLQINEQVLYARMIKVEESTLIT